MAESDPLVCHLCQELYKEPLILPCLHSLCKKCLIGEKEQQGTMDGKFKCPSCSECFDVPKGGVTGFPVNLGLARQVEIVNYKHKISSGKEIQCDLCVKRTNGFAIVFCCECCSFLCLLCKENHERCRETAKHELVKIGAKESISNFGNDDGNKLFNISQKPLYCSVHPEEKLKFYCEQCKLLTCRDCIVINHREHKINDYKAVAEIGRDEILVSVHGSTELVQCLDKVIDEGEEMIERITTRKREIEDHLTTSFDVVMTALENRKKFLINEASTIADSKIIVIREQLNTFRKLKGDFVSAEKFAKDALQNQPPGELLSSKMFITDRIQSTVTKYNKESKVINENDLIFASIDPSMLTATIENFGSVAPFDLSRNVFEKGFAIPLATVNVERTFSISLHDTKGSRISSIPNNLLVSLKDPNGQETKVSNFTLSNSIISFSSLPKVIGVHYLSIMINGSHVRSSPFRLLVKNPKNYSSLTNQQNFAINGYPWGIAVHTNGDIYVSNISNGCINVFSSNGTQKHTFGSSGSGDGQFRSPLGLMIMNDIVYICDNGNHRIQKWSLNGEYIGKFGSNGKDDGQFNEPWGITHDGNDHILVADYSNTRVQIFDTNDSFVRKIDCQGNTPSDVAVDNDSNIHVLYSNEHCVTVFSPEGECITTYSNTSDNCHNPTGIAIDDQGLRFISCQSTDDSDYYGNSLYLHVVNTNGQQVNLLSGCKYPTGVAIDQHGAVYVADYINQRVKKYM